MKVTKYPSGLRNVERRQCVLHLFTLKLNLETILSSTNELLRACPPRAVIHSAGNSKTYVHISREGTEYIHGFKVG